ncbi:MAG TPA: DUF2357 domain-containing protein, partial [Rhodothermales bacterium]|nr:DUF2357 domain-containing protein [Rhodothermales bacterium]
TDALRLVWSQRRTKPVPVLPKAAAPPFGLEVTSLQAGVEPVVQHHTAGGTHLFEQTNYTLLVQSKTRAPVAVRHRDPVLMQGLHRADAGDVVHGTLNFGTQVGRSRFVVDVGDRPHLTFEVEVFPSKMTYREDYEALRADVQDIAAELALAYLRATYAPGWEGPPEVSGRVAWLLLLRHAVDDLENALGYIARQPAWGTQRSIEPIRAHRIRRVNGTVRRAVLQGAGQGTQQVLDGEMLIREQIPAPSGRYTLDTPEHRWLAAQVLRTRQQLVVLQDEEVQHRRGIRRRQVLNELEVMQHRLVQMSQLEPLREASTALPQEPSLRLMTAPGYREAYQACLFLQQGLTVEGGPMHLGVQDLHLLYEYWCYLTLVRLVAEMTTQTMPWLALIAVERYGLHLRLRKGRAHTVRFELEEGQRLDLTYNPRFGGKGFLVPQQPDILLTLHRADGTRARYILDAKYRLDATPSYKRRYGTPGPPTDALNDLHRYRDALRGGKKAPPVAQALALFPHREATPGRFAESRLYRMLGEIGVGALPLLPRRTAYLAAWLRSIVNPDG